MNDHSKQKSVNSRRSFIAGFGGVLAAAAALTKTTFGGGLERESLLVPASPSTPQYTEHHIPRDGVFLHVEDHGSGKPVLLLHGWPDSSYLWRNQIPFLVANGFGAIAPDQRGFGRSDRPEEVAAYSLQNAVADLVGILDALGIDAADIAPVMISSILRLRWQPPPICFHTGVIRSCQTTMLGSLERPCSTKMRRPVGFSRTFAVGLS